MSENRQLAILPVIAIGASAGGLEVCRALLKDMPADAAAAFILIMHLDPTHDSMMVDLLARHTRLKIVQATDGQTLQAGTVYVIPPGMFLTVAKQTVKLHPPADGKGVRLPLDVLLRSMAQDATIRPACVVLSGTGTDGTLGVAEIHAADGLVIAQDPNEAAYPGMPESAISTECVTKVLPIGEMLSALKTFWGVAPSDPKPDLAETIHPKSSESPVGDRGVDRYNDILAYIDSQVGQNLLQYKRGTLERRIMRRMGLVGLEAEDVTKYLALLRSDANESSAMATDLLIHVTSFFRDPDVFEHLSAKAIPDLVADMKPDRALRVWVAGCSTGEEAYSLAMTCIEVMEVAGSNTRLQILASDVDPEAIATARAGFYSSEIENTVSPARLARFFVAENGGYRVTASLRDQIVFTVADLLVDPPFSKIDLVSCRNVMIYLAPEAQKRVIACCCFALRPGGFLLLGAAEMPGQSDKCFASEHKRARLWRRVGQSQLGDLRFAISKRNEIASPEGETPVRRASLADICRKFVLENYAPAAVLLNSRLECLYFLGPTEKYLKVTQGHPDLGIIGMLPKAMRSRFRAAAGACDVSTPRVTLSGGRMAGVADFDIVLHAVPVGSEALILVCFVEGERRSSDAAVTNHSDIHGRQSVDLEADLDAARSDLSDALRDLEHEIEAHGADNAEALSVNEEFQSTNEELLASKEELQSLNEELTALNNQLQETLERHRTTANDLQNVLYSTDVATLFLDHKLNIRFFTPAARAIFRVIPTDVGRPLADLAAVAKDDELASDADAVLRTSVAIERETAGVDGRWFLRRIQPYRAEGGRVEGIVITYVDITDRKRTNAALSNAMAEAERATKAKSRFLASASHDLRQPLQAMALLHKLMARSKKTTEVERLGTLLDQTLLSMTAMLDSMLDVNRIDSGIVRPDMRPVAIGPLIQLLADQFGPQCNIKGLKLRSVASKAWVQTDPQLLEQILRNLLSNAMKYTPEGGILLGCRRRGNKLDILVCDSGIGVPETEKTSIFEPYLQGEKAADLAGPGLGLGLSIVQRLAQLMDHPVSLRSSSGRGSIFSISLPIVQAPPLEEQSVPTAPLLTGGARRTGRILLVEDNDQLRGLLAEFLVEAGHTVIDHATAQAALDWAKSDVLSPDLLLTDLELTGAANGLALAKALPDIVGTPVPTIILTGDITTETLKSLDNSGFLQIIKPVMPEVLLTLISNVLVKPRVLPNRGINAVKGTIYIVDDDPIIRETMGRLFVAEGWVVVTYSSAEKFLAQPRPNGSSCLVVDNVLPGMGGVALIAKLRAEKSQLPVIVLTGHGDAATAVAAMKAGASDLLEKPASAAQLLMSVRQAIAAEDQNSPQPDTPNAAQKRFAGLTLREREVLAAVLIGTPNKNIAADLGINQRTVEHHRASVMRKTGAVSLPALVRLAFAAGAQSFLP